MRKKISKAEARKRLAIGVHFTGEYIGKVNLSRSTSGLRVCRRKVVKQNTKEMECQFVSGPKNGMYSFVAWKETEVYQEDDALILTLVDGEPFLRIRFTD